MRSMNQLGNDLYTGKTSVPFVARRTLWFAIAAILVIASVLVVVIKTPQFSIEFTGGTQFTVVDVKHAEDQDVAEKALQSVVPDAVGKVTTIGGNSIKVQTGEISTAPGADGAASEADRVSAALAKAYDVPVDNVSSSAIGASWGEGVTRQSLWGLGIFLALAFLILALYFRTWKMSAAAIIGLVDVLVITVGVYALFGFEISPAAVIGFLTILGYSLYDTTVVFDKIRETTSEQGSASHRTFGESVNLGVNQTLVRSINTSIVAVLPVGAILVIGATWMGAQTLSDISLSITVGIIVAAYSTLFVAAPLYSLFRENEPKIRAHDKKVLSQRRAEEAVSV
ncbi:protein translocase subunit SecF [Microbacterium gorillae]|uniref:protein translocase subunit SecF n=1 Tax=Microbacterium gorillae TaxID=1231063 RepID=UPI0005907B4B|nr:protein translocase subunit SecF [Microbacterium gorillae]